MVSLSNHAARDTVQPSMSPTQNARLTLAIGLAFVLGYFGIDKFIHPLNWIAWMPNWMDGLAGMSTNTWLSLIGGFETLLALGLYTPWKNIQHWTALIVALHLTSVVLVVGWNDIGIRDAGLTCAASALWYLSKPEKSPSKLKKLRS